MPDNGDCAFIRSKGKDPYFLIRIDRTLDDTGVLHVLCHEWAHALSWNCESHLISHHGPEWGIAMARVWQSLLED